MIPKQWRYPNDAYVRLCLLGLKPYRRYWRFYNWDEEGPTLCLDADVSSDHLIWVEGEDPKLFGPEDETPDFPLSIEEVAVG